MKNCTSSTYLPPSYLVCSYTYLLCRNQLPHILHLVLIKLQRPTNTHVRLNAGFVQEFMDGSYTTMTLQKMPFMRCCKVMTMPFIELHNLPLLFVILLQANHSLAHLWDVTFCVIFCSLPLSIKPSGLWTFPSSLTPALNKVSISLSFPYFYQD